jgi:hypothetical protein
VPAELVHVSLAAGIAGALPLGPVDPAQQSAFVLGSVATDVNNLLGWTREETHFWPWPDEGNPSGAHVLLARYPQLQAQQLAPLERAFVAGYLCHLLTDEQEILTLSRPYVTRLVGVASPEWREVRLAALIVVDAAVEASDPPRLQRGIGQLRDALQLPLSDPLLPFLRLEDVRAWANLTLAVSHLPPGQPRVQPHRAQETPSPDLRARRAALIEYVGRAIPPQAIAELMQRAGSESLDFCAAYLDGGPLPVPRGTAPPPPAQAHRGFGGEAP